jgi:hypothetical protein
VGLLDGIRAVGRREAKTRVHVVEDTRLFEGNQGDTIWCGGYAPVDQRGVRLSEAEHRTSDPRVFCCQVAGTHHRPTSLTDARFDLGSPILLRTEASPFDGYTVGIWDGSGTLQVGYVPPTLSRTVAGLMRSGTALGGQVLREFRLRSPEGERSALHVLIAPAGAGLELVVHAQAGEARGGLRARRAAAR